MFVNAAAAALIVTALLTSTAVGTQAGSPAGGQTAPAPQAATPQATSTASLAGKVSGSDGSPVRRARVTLRSTSLPQPRVALTDARGEFRFERLSAAAYDVGVTRTGFALPHAAGGANRSVAVTLNAGESRTGLAIVLQRAGTIPGRLLDEDGSPLAGAEIEALSLRGGDRLQVPTHAGTARSDDRGQFRLTGLPAGQYLVVARDPSFTAVGDESGTLRYAPTYFPGVHTAADAQVVTVAEGAETAAIEFRLRIVRPSQLVGTMLPRDRRALISGAVVLMPRDALVAMPLPPEDIEILPDGRFRFRNVAPGRYQIRARAEIGLKEPMLFGSYAVTVEGQDITGIVMPLAPGAVVRGTIEWEPAGAAQPPKLFTGLRVRAPFADGSSFGDSLSGDISTDRQFQIRGVMPGSHYLVVEGLASPWIVTAVQLRGHNVVDQPTEFTEGESHQDVRIVVSAVAGELSGTVRDKAGRPAADALVVTLPPAQVSASRASPRFRTVRAAADGRFRLGTLPPGQYRVAALTGIDELVAERREWLTGLAAGGQIVTIGGTPSPPLTITALDASALGPVPSR